MKQAVLSAAFTIGLVASTPLFAQEETQAEPRFLTLEEISGYLNELGSVETTFTQVNADNTLSTGTLWLKRPGRIRFEYDPPDAALVMAFGGQLAIFDKKSNEMPESYPVRRTPLWLLLEKNVDLTDQKMVVGHGFDGRLTYVEAMDPKRPEHGSIQLRFASDPVLLKEWVVFDTHGGETTVSLGEFNEDVEIENQMFNIQRMIHKLVPQRDDD